MSHRLTPLGFTRAPLVAQLGTRGLDGLLLTSPEAVYYTTGLPTLSGSSNPILHALKNQLPFFAYIGADGQMTLVCWIGATMGFEFAVDNTRNFFDWNSAGEELRDLLKDQVSSAATIGVEATCPLYVAQIVQSVTAMPVVVAADELLLAQRLRKSPDEIALMRRATAIVEAAVAELSAHVVVGASRLALIGEAKRTMLTFGATGVGHTTIAFGTSNPEIAFDEILQANQIVTLDLGAVVDGYCSDNRRLLYTGTIPDDLQALHQTMVGIVGKVGDALQPGTPFADLYTLATQLYEAQNLPPFFLTVGHSIGLQTEEVWITPDSPYMVQAGMVLNIELYTPYVDGSNIGDEETFLVTDSGPVRLTQANPVITSIY